MSCIGSPHKLCENREVLLLKTRKIIMVSRNAMWVSYPCQLSKQYLEFKWNQHTGLSAHPCVTHMFQNAVSICDELISNGKERTSSITAVKWKSMTTHCRHQYYNMGMARVSCL